MADRGRERPRHNPERWNKLRLSTLVLVFIVLASLFDTAQTASPAESDHAQEVCARCIHAHMDFLASDVLRGRGSGTQDELIAATYAASELLQYGVEPAGDNDNQYGNGFIQEVALPEGKHTWNTVGILRGSDPVLAKQAILLSAHLDHLGVGKPVNGDNIYNGADDDASGVSAVLELARVLASGPRPRRTVIFALYGSEETGGQGSTYFREHPPVPLDEIVANLEFEMIGRRDPMLPGDDVFLTGYKRSNLGPQLAAHGAHLLPNPHTGQNFFQRSDNFVLAKRGVVAHTVSSFGLHADYHKPSDDLSKIDFPHMYNVIGSLVKPMQWLVNSDFKPEWVAGEKP